MRIAIAGFQHETNTFVATPTTLNDFEQADSWPALLTGQDVLDTTQGMNLPIAGFAKAAADEELYPILWCAAEPGGKVNSDAFETIAERIITSLDQLGPLDAVYLDLHGAMVTVDFDDGEGELLARVRDVIGPDVPLVASLDLHANVTQEMVDQTDAMTIFRTYPHLDMAETGARAYRLLQSIVDQGRPAKAWRQIPFLVPLHAQQTDTGPARSLYAGLDPFDGSKTQLAEIAMGFTAADIADAGPSVLAYGPSSAEAMAVADELYARFEATESAFDCVLLTPSEALAQATQVQDHRPVIIADVQDNPGAGGSSDTTGLLRELIRQDVPSTLLGLIHDPTLAQQARTHGEGACFEAAIGGRGPGDTPVHAMVRVQKVSDGTCAYTGEMYGGGVATLGPAAALQLVGTQVHIVVISIRNQCLDLAQFRHFGLEPEQSKIVCVKSTAHFRADFEPIASTVLLCAAPGQFPCLLQDVSYTKLRPNVRLIAN